MTTTPTHDSFDYNVIQIFKQMNQTISIKFDKNISLWYFQDNIQYEYERLKDYVTIAKIGIAAERKCEQEQKFIDSISQVNTGNKLADALIEMDYEHQKIIATEKRDRCIERMQQIPVSIDEVNHTCQVYHEFTKRAKKFLSDTGLLVHINTDPLLNKQQCYHFIRSYFNSLTNYVTMNKYIYDYKDKDKNYNAHHDENQKYKVLNEKFIFLRKLLYYIPETKDMINDMLFQCFLDHKTTIYITNYFTNSYHYRKSKISYVYYFTGSTWFSGIYYYFKNMQNDVEYISFLKKHYVNHEYVNIDFVAYMLQEEDDKETEESWE